MTALLSKAGSKLTVKQLLDTLAETMEFEASVVKKFSTPVCSISRLCLFLAHVPFAPQLREILKATTPANATRPNKPITSAFEAHMGVYIDAQDK